MKRPVSYPQRRLSEWAASDLRTADEEYFYLRWDEEPDYEELEDRVIAFYAGVPWTDIRDERLAAYG